MTPFTNRWHNARKTFFAPFILLFLCTGFNSHAYDQSRFPSELTRIAVGSCAKEYLPQPIWETIGAANPDLFLFIGDNQYADVHWIDGKRITKPVTEPERFTEAYSTLAAIPEFASFRSRVPFMATWDDHDYGKNDGGAEYSLKTVSQQAFLDFFGFAEDDPLRQQAGIYHARTFGEPGRQVQIIMLDSRYHRDALNRNPDGRPPGKGPYIPVTDTSSTLLGEQQWQWLEQQLKQPADVRFIISSIQVVAYQHAWETWGNFPHERQRLYDLIAKTKANGVVFVSGDRHLMELSKDTGLAGYTTPYPVWDFTVSGMTDRIKTVNEENRYRVGPVYRGSHFGVIDIDWAESLADTQIRFIGYDEQGGEILSASVSLGTLTP